MRHNLWCILICTNNILWASSDGVNGTVSMPVWEPPVVAFGTGFASSAILAAQAPEAAFAHAAVLNTRLHGNIGEALVSDMLHTTGGWKTLSARDIPQGIDHLWMKYDEKGIPRDLIVGETKYGAGRLSMTNDGLQMSSKWISRRLAKQAKWYETKAAEEATKTGQKHRVLERHYKLTAQYLKAAAEGRVSYRSEIYNVEIKGNEAHISLAQLDANGHPTGDFRKLPPITIKGRPARIVKTQIAKELKTLYPTLSNAELRARTDSMYTVAKTAETAISARGSAPRLALITIRSAAAAGLVAGGIDLAVQIVTGNDSVNWSRTGIIAGIGTASSIATEVTSIAALQLLGKNNAVHIATISLGRSMGLLPAHSAALAPKAAGGIVGALVFAYGGYALGLYDATEAHRTAIAGTAGAAAGMLAYSATEAGLMACAAAWGTASTGTAISSLSGAAATNASLAWLGGGAVSAEGGGMASGAALLSATGVAVAAVAVVVVTATVMYSFHLHDAAEDWKRVGNTARVLRDHKGDFPGNPWATFRPASAF